jgi:hypothetical protein
MERHYRQPKANEARDITNQEGPNEPETMSSWLSRTASSHQAQLVGTAVVSGVVVAGAILGYQHIRRQEEVEDLKRSIPDIGADHIADKVSVVFIPTELGAN